MISVVEKGGSGPLGPPPLDPPLLHHHRHHRDTTTVSLIHDLVISVHIHGLINSDIYTLPHYQ